MEAGGTSSRWEHLVPPPPHGGDAQLPPARPLAWQVLGLGHHWRCERGAPAQALAETQPGVSSRATGFAPASFCSRTGLGAEAPWSRTFRKAAFSPSGTQLRAENVSDFWRARRRQLEPGRPVRHHSVSQRSPASREMTI